jgi:small subunit ribosomal protein S4
MARKTGAKHKLCRRLGSCIWGNPKCPSNKRPYATGQHGPTQRRKMSVYGAQLQDKQTIRTHYWLMEKQMRRTFEKAQRMGGVTGTNLLTLLETRLDSIVYRLGFARSMRQARQLVTHGHITVDGQKCNMPSFTVKPGMKISIRERSRKVPVIAEGAEQPRMAIPEYLQRNEGDFEGHVVAMPNAETLPYKPDTAGVIGFYSR